MNTGRSLLSLLLFVTSLSLVPFHARAQEPSQLEVLRQSFRKQERVLLDTYGRSIDSVMDTSKKRGDLETYLAAEVEKKRFVALSVVPFPAKAPAALKDAADTYCRARIVLIKKQISALDAYIKEEVRFDQIDNAKAGKSDRDAFAAELATLESNVPREEVLKGGAPAPKDDGLKAGTPIRPKPVK